MIEYWVISAVGVGLPKVLALVIENISKFSTCDLLSNVFDWLDFVILVVLTFYALTFPFLHLMIFPGCFSAASLMPKFKA